MNIIDKIITARKNYMNHTWTETCSNCGTEFTVHEMMQTTICGTCYKNNPQYARTETVGTLWIVGWGFAGTLFFYSLFSLNWIGMLWAIGLAVVSLVPLILMG